MQLKLERRLDGDAVVLVITRWPELPGETPEGAIETVLGRPGELSVEALAQRVHMSPRHFARVFRTETGVTPARYVESIRLEAARRALEDSAQPVSTVALTCGFGTSETMRRSFLRALGVSPAEYRRRFHPSGSPSDETAAA